MTRLQETLAEIKQVARLEPMLAAEGDAGERSLEKSVERGE